MDKEETHLSKVESYGESIDLSLFRILFAMNHVLFSVAANAKDREMMAFTFGSLVIFYIRGCVVKKVVKDETERLFGWLVNTYKRVHNLFETEKREVLGVEFANILIMNIFNEKLAVDRISSDLKKFNTKYVDKFKFDTNGDEFPIKVCIYNLPNRNEMLHQCKICSTNLLLSFYFLVHSRIHRSHS